MFNWPLLLVCVFTASAALAQAPLRDPTRPLSAQAEEEEAETLALHSVLISASRKIAVINGFTVREGKTLPGAEHWVVQKIEPGAVVVADQQQRRRLELASRMSGVNSTAYKPTGDTQAHNKQEQGCNSSTCVEVKQ